MDFFKSTETQSDNQQSFEKFMSDEIPLFVGDISKLVVGMSRLVYFSIYY
tara:strand:- start:1322 stop:1471 length:150 start_codon:yes stop_codon:yes gene_type:complete